MPRRRALAARAAAACRPGSMSTPSRCRAASARFGGDAQPAGDLRRRDRLRPVHRRDLRIGNGRARRRQSPRQTCGGEPPGHRLRVHPVPGGELARESRSCSRRRRSSAAGGARFAHPARAAGTEPATARSDRNVVLQQPRPHQMRRRVQPLGDRGDRQTVVHVQLPQPVGGGPLHRGQRPLGRFFNDPDGGVSPASANQRRTVPALTPNLFAIADVGKSRPSSASSCRGGAAS